MQRQDKSKLLSGNSQTLIRVAQKHEAQKQQLAAFTRNLDMRRKPSKPSVGARGRRFSDIGQATNSTLLLGKHNPDRRLSDAFLPGIIFDLFLNLKSIFLTWYQKPANQVFVKLTN